MVPLRSEYDADSSATTDQQNWKPRLVLYDIDADAAATSVKSKSLRRKRQPGWDTKALAVGVIAVFVFFAFSFASFFWSSAAGSYRPSAEAALPVVTKHVAHGDTLWQYAKRYGDPNTYILDRVETLARANHVSPNSPLVPGQLINVALRKPGAAIGLARQRPSRIAALPRS